MDRFLKPTPRQVSSTEPSGSESIWKVTPKKSRSRRSSPMLCSVSVPSLSLETSSGPSAMSTSASGWLDESHVPASRTW